MASVCLSALASGVIALGAIHVHAEDFQRVLTVSDRPDVYVSTRSGNVIVTASNDGRFVIVGHVHARRGHRGLSDERIRRIAADPPIQQTGNEVHIGEPTDHNDLLNNISVDYEIQAPVEAALNLRSGSGDLSVQGLGRFLAANTGSGSVRARDVRGAADLRTGSGDIELAQAGQGEVHVQTGSGSLRLHDLQGPLNAHTGSGDIEADGRLQGPGEIGTGSGSIRIRIASGSGFDLKASTGSGDIRAHLPGLSSVDVDHHRLSGPVNGGGPLITVHTGSGDIEIASAP